MESFALGRIEDYFVEMIRFKLEPEIFQLQKEGVYQQLPVTKIGNYILITTLRDMPHLVSSWDVTISATKTSI